MHCYDILDRVERDEVIFPIEIVANSMIKKLSLEKFKKHASIMGFRET